MRYIVFAVMATLVTNSGGCNKVDKLPSPSKQSASIKPSVIPHPTVGPPDLAMLYAKANEPVSLTEAQKAEELAYDRRQVEIYARQLARKEKEQRIVAVEQLGAYFTPIAEQYLTRTLSSDKESEVRLAAVHVLQAQNRLSRNTLEVLLKAALDRSAEVQSSALLALATTVNKEEQAVHRAWILAQLRHLRTAKQLSKQGAEHLRDLLEQWPDSNSKLALRRHR